jgi:NAD(P)-dependent dehydrogenase (short-subunit alcohol dehydrogenase family)
MAVNVTGPFLLAKAVLGRPQTGAAPASGMFARGYGRIVNVASIAGPCVTSNRVVA